VGGLACLLRRGKKVAVVAGLGGALISRVGGGLYGAVQGYEFSKHAHTDQGRSAFGLWPGSSLWKDLRASAEIARAWWPALQITQLPRLMPVRMVRSTREIRYGIRRAVMTP